MNLPNKLTILRVLMIPFYVCFQLNPMPGCKWVALALFCVASFTDFLDGQIARKKGLVTNFGKFMDPLADKLLVCSALICFTQLSLLPAWIVIIIVAREFRLIAAEQGVVIAASYWGKFKTVSQMGMIILLIIDIEHPAFIMAEKIFTYLALALTVISLVDYIRKNIGVLSNGGF